MTVSLAIFTFLNVWWVVLFAVLPWGVSPPANPEKGHSTGAPEKPGFKKKLLLTTVIAIVITALIALMIHYRVIPLRNTL